MIRTLLSLISTVAFAGTVLSCPFCASDGQTLSNEVDQADFIVMGDLTNAQPNAGDITRGHHGLNHRHDCQTASLSRRTQEDRAALGIFPLIQNKGQPAISFSARCTSNPKRRPWRRLPRHQRW